MSEDDDQRGRDRTPEDGDVPRAGEPPEPQDGPGLDDTQPVQPAAPSYPPPSPQQPSAQQPPEQTAPLPQQPGFGPPPPSGAPLYGPPAGAPPYGPPSGAPPQPSGAPPYGQQFGQPYDQSPGQQFAQPYGQPGYEQQSFGREPSGSTSQGGTGRGRLPGWSWPVITALALVVGLLGGVLGALLVDRSDGGVISAGAPISTDNGAAAPLKADNGSVAAVAARLLPSTVQVQANGGADGSTKGGATGSGFVLDDQGHVITNNHVVADATGAGELKVVDRSGRQHAAKIIGRSPVYDLAVLDVSGAGSLHPASIGSAAQLRVGDTVVAIGSPLGLSSTVTSGIVSATNRPVTTGDATSSSYINALQTDAAINPGNSGGPLVNLRGQVVGVNSAIATTGGTVGGESGNIGVGFAIPVEQVRVTAGQILATGKARYPVIGASVNTTRGTTGAKVVAVPSGSPAAKAGLRADDVVIDADGKPITNGIDLIVNIRSHQAGQRIDLRVRRGSQRLDVTVRLDSKVG